MSWQEYVDSRLIGTKKVVKAGIYGHNGSTWANSANFGKVNANEISALNSAFDDPTGIATNGLYLEGEKYLFVRQPEPNIIYGRKGSDPIVAVKTAQAIIIGTGDETRVAGELNNVVEGLATYLQGYGY